MRGLRAPSLGPRDRGSPYADEQGARESNARRWDESGTGRAGPGKHGNDANQTAKLIDRVRRRIVGDSPCPVYGGTAAGPLTITNSAVLLPDKVMSVLRNGDSGQMRLEPDVYVNRRYITIPDDLTPRSVELFFDLTHEFLQPTTRQPRTR